MRIALLTLSFPPQVGGVQAYLSELFRRVGQWHHVTVVTPVRGAHSAEEMVRIRHPLPENVLGFWRALWRTQPDRVVVGHAHPQLLLAAAMYRRAPYLALAYGNDYLAAQRRWHRPLFNRLLAGAQPLITITQNNARQLHRLGAGQAQIIYPGTDPNRFSPSAWPNQRAPVLLTVGRLVPRKGVDTVLRALPDVRREFPDVSYLVAGTGPDLHRLQTLAAEMELVDAVRFLGQVSDAALPDLYRRTDIFVMPVREEERGTSVEGFGIVYLEASASGLPVVAGRSGGAAEAVCEGETGLVVEPQPEVVAAALKELLGDRALRRQLGAAGRRWVEEKMHWDRAAREMAEALELERR